MTAGAPTDDYAARMSTPGEDPDDRGPAGAEAPVGPQEQREPREKDSLEAVGLGPRKMLILLLLVIAAAFVYFVLLGGEARS